MIARSFGLMVGLVGLFATIGCSSDGLAPRYSVTGTVKYQGKPLPKGSITFIPEGDGGRGANGTVENGAYTLTTNDPGDGAFVGKYKVTIADLVVDLDAARQTMQKDAMKKNKNSSVNQMNPMTVDEALIGKMSRKAKNNVPSKYSQVTSSPLTAEVKAENNTFNFDLTD